MASKKNIVYDDHFTAQRKMSIKKDDMVVVIAGKDKGKIGKVLEVRPRENRVIVQAVNMVTKHSKPRRARPGAHQEGRHETEAPIDRSNVMLINPNHQVGGKPQTVRIGYKEVEGKKVRFDRKTGDTL